MVPEKKKDQTYRTSWRTQRRKLESGHYKRHPEKKPRLTFLWTFFVFALQLFGVLLRLMGLYRIGFKNAIQPRLVRHVLYFEDLPPNFDGYRLVHLTDLHLDRLPNLATVLANHLKGLELDLAVLTGDYRDRGRTHPEAILPDFKKIVNSIHAKDGILATFGNHDCASMLEPLEAFGVRVLINESQSMQRSGESILITGLDDVHYFYSEAAYEALETADPAFKIALVHSPEANGIASINQYSLYLCGHTHGGQICLPGGTPIFKHIRAGREFAKGFWRLGKMIGYTSPGAGVAGLPVRFHCPGEITHFTLRRGRPPKS